MITALNKNHEKERQTKSDLFTYLIVCLHYS